MSQLSDRLLAEDWRYTRETALRAASYLSSDPANPDLVLANMEPIEAFLFGGDRDDRNDLGARRTAVSRHLGNIGGGFLSRGGPGPYTDNPDAFVLAAWKYYDRLMPPGPCPDHSREQETSL
jgi:hypothetical protein